MSADTKQSKKRPRFGKYSIQDFLGKGGMAEVFKAKMHGIGGFEKILVIKKILPHLAESESFIKMFFDEAKITVALQHPNIVQVFELGRIDGTYYMTMEFIDGVNLNVLVSHCMEKKTRLPFKHVIYVIMEVLKGLYHAHKAMDPDGGMPLNIIHRDVTHSNVLLSFTGNVKLADFGIAKARIQESREKPGMLKGKMSYMSPEMLKGKSIDHRVDIFSLGVVFFELLTMQKLFKGENEDEIIRKIIYGDIGRTLMEHTTIHDDVQEILKKALAADADERYASAQEFYTDLNDFIFNNGIQISPHEFSEFICGLVKQKSSIEGPEGSKPSSITDVTPSNISEIFKVESTIRERLNIDLSVMERFKPGSEVRGGGASRPTVPPKKGIEEKPAYSGDIGELLVPRLISRLAVNRVTGRLKITAGERYRNVFLEKGNIASVHSKLAEDSLEKFLIEHSSLPLEEIGEAAAGQQGDSVLRQFFNLGKITKEEMEKVAVMAYGSRLASLVTARGGRYEFFKSSKDNNKLLDKPLPVFPLLSAAVREGFKYEDYIQSLGRYLTHKVKRVENMKLPLESIALEPWELDLMKKILTNMNLRDIFETTKGMENKKMIACVIYLLYQYELIKFR